MRLRRLPQFGCIILLADLINSFQTFSQTETIMANQKLLAVAKHRYTALLYYTVKIDKIKAFA